MYVLDTNAAYNLLVLKGTGPQRLAELQQKATDGKFEVGLSPITVLELSSRVAEDPDQFERVKEVASILLSLKPKSLPDPEQRMREIVENVELARQTHEHWLTILETIAHAPSPDGLQTGFDDWATATHRKADVEHIRRYRADYEKQYVDDMAALATAFNPKYAEQVRKDKVAKLSVQEQAALQTFLTSAEWTGVFVATLGARAGTSAIPRDEGVLAVVLGKAKYFQLGYEELMRSMFCDGARPNLKRKNDYNDVHQLIYISSYTSDLLVSDDQGVITKAAGPDGRAITLEQLLAREAC